LFRELSRFIEHSRQIADERDLADAASAATDTDLLAETIALLEGRFMEEWKKTRQNLFFDQIGAFGNRLVELGITHALTIVKQYGQELSAHAQHFDVEKMNKTLNAYPEMIAAVKLLCAQK
jgi:hypothetical protein